MNGSDFITIGRLGRPHGIKGLITVVSFTEQRDDILKYMPWFFRVGNEWQALNLLDTAVNHKLILVRIEGYCEREQAATLTNTDIAIRRDALPQLSSGEFYWHQLIGMSVVNQQQIILGTVKEIMPTGANDVLIIEGENRYLIPYIFDKFIIQVDEKNKLILVDWDLDF
ncbi:MAG: ribosome maturation factor RimM [Legionella sp.]